MGVHDRSLGLRLGVAAGLSVVVLVPLALLAALVMGENSAVFDLDLTISTTLHGYAIEHPWLVRAMQAWSLVFSPMVLRVAALVLVIWLVRGRPRAPRLAWWVAVVMVAGGILAAVLKLLVGRHRPDLLDPVARAAGYSFPSGHATNAALAAGVFLLVLLPFTAGRPAARRGLWAAAVLVPLLPGAARVGLGVHWTSDVLAGWLLGAAVVAATAAGFEGWRRRSGRRPVAVAEEGLEPETARRPAGGA